jgi:hypothetical protein
MKHILIVTDQWQQSLTALRHLVETYPSDTVEIWYIRNFKRPEYCIEYFYKHLGLALKNVKFQSFSNENAAPEVQAFIAAGLGVSLFSNMPTKVYYTKITQKKRAIWSENNVTPIVLKLQNEVEVTELGQIQCVMRKDGFKIGKKLLYIQQPTTIKTFKNRIKGCDFIDVTAECSTSSLLFLYHIWHHKTLGFDFNALIEVAKYDEAIFKITLYKIKKQPVSLAQIETYFELYKKEHGSAMPINAQSFSKKINLLHVQNRSK